MANKDNGKLKKQASSLALVLSLFGIICGILGIYFYYSDSGLISVFGGIVLALTIVQILLGHQVIVPILAVVIGMVATTNLWIGACIGICFEAVISGIIAYIIVLVIKIKGPPPAPLAERLNENENSQSEDDGNID